MDNTFGSNGKLVTDFDGHSNFVQGIAIQDDGKIVAVGFTDDGTIQKLALVRYTSTGVLDNTFSTDGKLTNSSIDIGTALTLQEDGKIVVAGNFYWSQSLFALARYNSDGSLDVSFDSDGSLTTAIGVQEDKCTSVAIQTDGKIVAVGTSRVNDDYNFALVRYNDNGSLDASFGTDGKVVTDIGSVDNYANATIIQANGKIIVAGYSKNNFQSDFTLVRYNEDGTLDETFGSKGHVTTDFNGDTDEANAIALQSDGKIVVAGSGYEGPSVDFAVARYNNDNILGLTENSREEFLQYIQILPQHR